MPQERNDRERPVFVVGAPRTGTTLTMEILNLHPRLHLYNEVHYHERVVDVLGSEEPLADARLDAAVRILLEARPWSAAADDPAATAQKLAGLARERGGTHADVLAAFLAAEAEVHGKPVWGDSSPQDVLYLDALKAWYPGARFVGVVRDPRAFLASYKNYYRKRITGYRDRYNALTNTLLWRTYMNALVKASGGPFGADVHLVKYEDLVDRPEEEIGRICAFLGEDFEPRMLEVGRQNSSYFGVDRDRDRTGISAGSRDRWRQALDPAEIRLAERLCRVRMTEFGYEPAGVRLGVGDTGSILRILALLPGRAFNLLFRTGKPFTWQKVGRVLREFRGSS